MAIVILPFFTVIPICAFFEYLVLGVDVKSKKKSLSLIRFQKIQKLKKRFGIGFGAILILVFIMSIFLTSAGKTEG